jgi:hypothetical protein
MNLQRKNEITYIIASIKNLYLITKNKGDNMIKSRIKRPMSIFLITFFSIQSVAPLLAATIAGGTNIPVRLNQSLSGSNAQVGTFVSFSVTNDVKVDGVVVVKSGAQAEGQVTSAKKAGMIGMPGSIGVNVITVTAVDGKKIPVQAVSVSDGEDKSVTSIILGLLCILGFFMKGGEGELNSNLIINTRTLSDVEVNI